MKEKIITVAVVIAAIIALFYTAIHFWRNTYYLQMLDQMDCGVSLSDVKIEMISEERGGITMDGVTVYKLSIKEKYDTGMIEVSEWNDLPISDSIVNYYMINAQKTGNYLCNLENGSWKIVGKNKEEGIYRNIELYVYDEDGRCFYIYKWDS